MFKGDNSVCDHYDQETDSAVINSISVPQDSLLAVQIACHNEKQDQPVGHMNETHHSKIESPSKSDIVISPKETRKGIIVVF